MTRYRAVFISPHLDDAVFSCGGTIARLAAEGPVHVLNIFTRFDGMVKYRNVVLGPERYLEEKAAADFLGFSSFNLDEQDASVRRDSYRSIGNIFKEPVTEDTDEYLAALRSKIFGYLQKIEFDRIYIPMGIGWHVDHVLTFRVFEPWMGRENGPALTLYEDLPYCFIGGAAQYRHQELGLTHSTGNEAASWFDTTLAFFDTALMKNSMPGTLRWLALPVVGLYFKRLIPHHLRSFPSKIKLSGWMPNSVDVTQVLDRKLEAMALYKSQFREFFTGRRDCERLMRLYSGEIQLDPSRVIEQFWVRKSL